MLRIAAVWDLLALNGAVCARESKVAGELAECAVAGEPGGLVRGDGSGCPGHGGCCEGDAYR
jgi:hypothetical protein